MFQGEVEFDGTKWHKRAIDRPVDANINDLKSLILSKIAPASWMEAGKGGQGTLQYFPGDLSLIVSHEDSIHDEIMDLLKKLRQLPEVTIENRAFLAVAPQEEFKLHQFELPKEPTHMPAWKARMYRSYAVGKESIKSLAFPRITGFNGQQIKYSLEGFGVLEEVEISIQHVIAADRKSVQTRVVATSESGEDRSDIVESTNSGQTISIDVSRILPKDSQYGAVLMLKPIIFDEGELN